MKCSDRTFLKLLFAIPCLASSAFAAALDAPINLRITTTAPAQSSEFPGPTNTGYKNAVGYPGSIAAMGPCPSPVQSNMTYNNRNCPSGLYVPAGVVNVTFYGCRFASNALADANVAVYGDNITFDYSTFEPSAKSTPPVTYNQGYQYGIDQRAAGKLTIDHSDFWGWGNAIQFNYSTQTKPFTAQNSWFHDARNDGGIDHTDAILENYGGKSYITINHNTIVSVGNTNGLALQNGDKTGYTNVTVTNNYFSGFGYTVNLCGYFAGCSNYTFTDNTFGTDIKPGWGPLYAWTSGSGNLWRRNKWRVVSGGYYNIPADDGKYWTPDGLSVTDYTK